MREARAPLLLLLVVLVVGVAAVVFLRPIAREVEQERLIVEEIARICDAPLFVAKFEGLYKMSYINVVRLPESELSTEKLRASWCS